MLTKSSGRMTMRTGHTCRLWPAGAVGILWLAVTVATAHGQRAQGPWMSVVRGDVEVVGNAEAVRLRSLASRIAVGREALTALVPATTRIAVPVTFIVNCDGAEESRIISERLWRIYVVGGCGPVRGDEGDAVERYAQMVLRRAVQPLPLWLEVGVARFAMAAERSPGGGFQFARFNAADVRGYQYSPVPALEMFSARRTSEVWQNRMRRAAFIRQSLVYVHRVMQTGDIRACTGNADDSHDPEARLRQCLQSDIDRFHEPAMASWPEGLTRVMVHAGVEPSTPVEHVLSEVEWKGRVIDALLAAESISGARRLLAEWGLTAQSGPAVPGLLARVAEASGERAKARQLFEHAVAAHASPFDAYHYAAALLEPAVRAGTVERLAAPDATRAEALLDAVVREHPFAAAYALRGIAKLATGDHSRAIDSLSAAVDTSWDETYALWLARAFAAGHQTASARQLAESLRASSERVDVRRSAERLLRDLPAGEGDAAGLPVLPPLLEGEQRTRGRLLSIDCGADWVRLVVETPHGTERFVTARLSLTRFISFGPEPSPATCGPRRDTEPVVVNWRVVRDQPPDATGLASAVAFVER